jgi:hypothetical protein
VKSGGAGVGEGDLSGFERNSVPARPQTLPVRPPDEGK